MTVDVTRMPNLRRGNPSPSEVLLRAYAVTLDHEASFQAYFVAVTPPSSDRLRFGKRCEFGDYRPWKGTR